MENETDTPVNSENSDDSKEAPLIRSPTFSKKYVTKIVPFFTEFDVRMNLCNEVIKSEQGWNLVTDDMIILTPTAAKELYQELENIIKAYEELNGPIKDRSSARIYTTFTKKE